MEIPYWLIVKELSTNPQIRLGSKPLTELQKKQQINDMQTKEKHYGDYKTFLSRKDICVWLVPRKIMYLSDISDALNYYFNNKSSEYKEIIVYWYKLSEYFSISIDIFINLLNTYQGLKNYVSTIRYYQKLDHNKVIRDGKIVPLGTCSNHLSSFQESLDYHLKFNGVVDVQFMHSIKGLDGWSPSEIDNSESKLDDYNEMLEEINRLKKYKNKADNSTNKDIIRTEKTDERNFKIFIHSLLWINMVNPITNKSGTTKFAFDSIIQEIKFVNKLNSCLVIHTGSYKDFEYDEAFNKLVKNINYLLTFVVNSFILIETTAGEGKDICAGYNNFVKLINEFRNDNRIGICVDTCHVFTAGENPLEFCINIHKEFPGKLKLVHFNDSKSPLGACLDRHAFPGEGYIGDCLMYEIEKWCINNKVPFILE